jgi:hypothetical protein
MASTPINPEDIDKIVRKGFPTFGAAFTNRVLERLNKISPLVRSDTPAAPDKAEMDRLKYAVLVRFVDSDPSKPRIPYSVEVTVVGAQQTEEVQKLLLEEKLLEPSEQNSLRLTPRGRQFMEAMEQEAQK